MKASVSVVITSSEYASLISTELSVLLTSKSKFAYSGRPAVLIGNLNGYIGLRLVIWYENFRQSLAVKSR